MLCYLNLMLWGYKMEFISNFVMLLCDEYRLKSKFTSKQQFFLTFCIKYMILTNELNFYLFEKVSLGKYKAKALSYMMKIANINVYIM